MSTKHIIFICQPKGGAGKSTLTFLLSEKYKNNIKEVYDTDHVNLSTSSNLRDTGHIIKEFSFYSKDNEGEINSIALYQLIEEVKNSPEDEKQVYLIDCSATVSDNLKHAIGAIGTEELAELLGDYDIKMHFFIVVGGGSMYQTTLQNATGMLYSLFQKHLKNPIEYIGIRNRINATIFRNTQIKYSEEETVEVAESVKPYKNIKVIDYTLTENRGASVQNVITEMLRSGKGFSGLSQMMQLQFKRVLKEFNPFEELKIIN